MGTKNGLSKVEMQQDEETMLRNGSEWTKRVNVDIPAWAINELDKESSRRGITRQALIKTWLIDKIDSLNSKHPNVS